MELQSNNQPSPVRLTILQRKLADAEATLARLETKHDHLERWEPQDEQFTKYLIKYTECQLFAELQIIRRHAVARSMEVAAGRKHIGILSTIFERHTLITLPI
jgi:hypothetical protein